MVISGGFPPYLREIGLSSSLLQQVSATSSGTVDTPLESKETCPLGMSGSGSTHPSGCEGNIIFAFRNGWQRVTTTNAAPWRCQMLLQCNHLPLVQTQSIPLSPRNSLPKFWHHHRLCAPEVPPFWQQQFGRVNFYPSFCCVTFGFIFLYVPSELIWTFMFSQRADVHSKLCLTDQIRG